MDANVLVREAEEGFKRNNFRRVFLAIKRLFCMPLLGVDTLLKTDGWSQWVSEKLSENFEGLYISAPLPIDELVGTLRL